MEFPKNTAAHQEKSKGAENGLDRWNDRLDENLESDNQNDVTADEQAKSFSEKEGSGNQSDEVEKD
ncbi:hypothetical protein [Pedobacter rhodius]|uniref:Uncharacterized protein n=1 Tax=Pedobacter rhodius TaxID=3004098 RepID=A0ABT4KWD8_9SPHI|nr:hypothetical protein [Pedobacter sp. SJ11]MCZ4223234.1 hypothetical protein [Pedobacter sp. SJ11]